MTVWDNEWKTLSFTIVLSRALRAAIENTESQDLSCNALNYTKSKLLEPHCMFDTDMK